MEESGWRHRWTGHNAPGPDGLFLTLIGADRPALVGVALAAWWRFGLDTFPGRLSLLGYGDIGKLNLKLSAPAHSGRPVDLQVSVKPPRLDRGVQSPVLVLVLGWSED